MIQNRISFVGAGRVAGSLCKELFIAGLSIDLIVSESEINGCSLAESCDAGWSSELIFPDSTDIIIVSVPDHRLESVLSKIRCRQQTLVVHTAGSFGMDIFPEQIIKRGIFYPLQTFSRERKVDFKDLPFLIEASDIQSLAVLSSLAETIGGKVHLVDTEHRRLLHIAAVFICNFTNFMVTEGAGIALKAGFSMELLTPLLKETISKAVASGAEKSQTGPAVRNDRNTIEKHLELLSYSPDLQKLYSEVTEAIIKYYNKS
jgi:predicted short-subunit dehydrogenase-like oxidoreductase (DUF2520 family)